MNILSVFDNISGHRIGLERSGVTVDWYYTLETNRHYSKIAHIRYPNSVMLGDIININYRLLPQIDLIVGTIQHQNSLHSGNSSFFEYYYLFEKLKELNPDIKFLLCVNKMNKGSSVNISRYLKVEPVGISNKLVTTSVLSHYFANWSFGVPDKYDIKLSDILDDKVDGKYYIDDAAYDALDNRVLYKHNMVKCIGKDNVMCGDNGMLRKFTPSEYEKVKSIPAGYTGGILDKHRYSAIGNCSDINTLSHIFSHM